MHTLESKESKELKETASLNRGTPSNMPLIIQENAMQVEGLENRKPLRDLTNIYYEPIQASPDSEIRSPLCAVGHVLRSMGVSEEGIRIAILAMAAMISARVENPHALILIDKGSNSQQILEFAKMFVPKEALFECLDLPQDKFYGAAPILPGMAIVNTDFSLLKKSQRDIELMIECRHVARQEQVSSRFGNRMEALEIDGCLSLVSVARDYSEAQWHGNSVLKIPVNGGEQIFTPKAEMERNFLVDTARIRKSNERLKPCKIDITFGDVLLHFLHQEKIQNPESILKPLFSLIRILNIGNNPERVFEDEIMAKQYGIDQYQLRHWLGERGYRIDLLPPPEALPRVATKVDYHLAKILFGDEVSLCNRAMTDKNRRVLRAVIQWNEGRLGNTVANLKSDIDKLATIAKNNTCWADRETVFEMVNNDGGEFMSLSTVNNELFKLIDIGVIERQKVPKETKFGYYVLTFDAGSSIKLPPASSIIDPIYEGKPVQVVNPITGLVETI